MFRLVAITLPEECAQEPEALELAASRKEIQGIHLRKPGWNTQQMRDYLEKLSPSVREKIRLHDHHGLFASFHLQGLHLNRRHPLPPAGYLGPLSASCHKAEEAGERLGICDYVFLSPFFKSLSKDSYGPANNRSFLAEASHMGQALPRIVALGGITAGNIGSVKAAGFGGAAFIGALWQDFGRNPDMAGFASRLENLIRHAQQD